MFLWCSAVRSNAKMFFVTLVFLFLTHFCCAFNIDEINSVYYDIDILGKPIVEEKFDEEVLMMVNRLGQKYACILPTIPSDLKGQGSKDDSAAHEDSVDISGLLKPMEAAPCLVTTKDWWTYEFCYGHVIKQYHLEDGKSSGMELILGKYESEYDWSSGGKGGADASASGNSNRLQRFHSQFYTNGTKCDLTGEPRKAEVRFKCESDIGDFIERVDEPESCRYIVTVATSKVCHHPYLRPHPDRTPHHIRCSPVLSPERFNHYTNLQERKRKIAEEAMSAAQESSQIETDEDRISIEVINFDNPMKTDQHKKLLDTVESSLSRLTSGADAGDKIAPSPSHVAEEGGSEAAATGVYSNAGIKDQNDAVDKDDVMVEEEKILEYGVHQDDKKTSLDKFIEQFGERLNQATSGDVASNIVKVREQLSENTAELQELLEETLADLERELEALADLAEINGETAKLGLWRMLITKVRALQTKTEMLNQDRRYDPEPERGSPEWLQWRLKKNQKTITKAQETLGNVSDMKKLLTKKASVTDSMAELSRTEKEKKHAEMDEEDKFMDLFSGQFVDELLEQYVADQDAGSKEGETIADKMDKPKEIEEDEDEHSVMIGSLQESIKDKLKKSGLDVNKHKIEVKILTPGTLMEFRSGEEEKISAEQAHSVETLVIKLMGAQKEEIVEKQKHQSLSENYNFSFDEPEDDGMSAMEGEELPSGDPDGGDDSNTAGEG